MSEICLNNYDLELLNNLEELEKLQIIIYGVGNYGREVFIKLFNCEILAKAFCDKSVDKVGQVVEGLRVLSINELEKKAELDELLVIIAIQDLEIADRAHSALIGISKLKIVSAYAALKAAFIYRNKKKVQCNLSITMNWMEKWYFMQSERIKELRDVKNASVLVYQNGKVGSSTLWHSILDVGIECAHLHYIGKDEMVQYLICDQNDYENLAERMTFHNEKELINDYICKLRERKPLKIITLVREPISVDISTVFQFLWTDYLDRYLIKGDSNFSTAILELILKFKNRLFNWFDTELNNLFGIDIYDYPFDKDKGYTYIEKDGLEIIVLQLEKLQQLEKLVGHFIGRENFKIKTYNQAVNKEYRFIYNSFLKEIKLPKEYIDFYYNNNSSMDYFYSKNMQKNFLEKWKKNIFAG